MLHDIIAANIVLQSAVFATEWFWFIRRINEVNKCKEELFKRSVHE